MFGSVATLAFVPSGYDFNSYGRTFEPTIGDRNEPKRSRWSGWLVATIRRALLVSRDGR